MIQRKQSIYLFFAAIILSITYFVPLSAFIGEKDSLVLNLYNVESLVPGFGSPFSLYFNLPLIIPVTLIVIISIVTIFLYNNRRLQLILVRLMLLLLLVYIGVYFFYYVEVLESKSGGFASYMYSVPIMETGIQIPTVIFIIPLVVAMLLTMASKGIRNDDNLIKSTDRLR